MQNWELLLVKPQTKIIDAISTLDKLGKRLILIADDDHVLLGTVTDGDIRRALIKQIPMDRPVSDIMCKEPKFVRADWIPEVVKTTMEQHDLLHLPILDRDHKIVGLQTLQDLLKKQTLHFDNPVFIIAGGFGTRLHPLTENCPKPLLKVGSKPILELILERFISSGFHRFFISTHYLHDMISDYFGDGSRWGVTIEYIYEDKPLGTAGGLGLLPHHEIEKPLIMMNADLMTTLDFASLLSFHELHGGAATMCARKYEHRVPYGVIQSNEHRVLSIEEKPVHSWFINAGIYVLSPQLVKSVIPGQHLDMPTLLEIQIAAGQHVNVFPVHEYWLDIGRMEDYQLAQIEVAEL